MHVSSSRTVVCLKVKHKKPYPRGGGIDSLGRTKPEVSCSELGLISFPALGLCVMTHACSSERVMYATVALLFLSAHVCAGAVKPAPCPRGIAITVVFNCFIWPDQDWALLVRSQLDNLVSTGLADCANIHVVMSIPSAHDGWTYEQLEGLLTQGRALVSSILTIRHPGQSRGAIISQIHENSFEYPALHLLWLLATVRPLTNVLCHFNASFKACKASNIARLYAH